MGFAHYQSPKLLGSSPPIKNKHGVSRKHGNGALPYTEVERLGFGIAGLQGISMSRLIVQLVISDLDFYMLPFECKEQIFKAFWTHPEYIERSTLCLTGLTRKTVCGTDHISPVFSNIL